MSEMWVNFGPQHPFTHGLWRLRVKIDGETVTDVDPTIGYLHRGVEKIAENRDWEKFIPYNDRLCYVAAISWSEGYVGGVEKLMEIEPPERALYLRTIAFELQRIASHFVWLAAYGMDLGSFTGFMFSVREREYVLDLLSRLAGHRMSYNYPRFGGVARDAPPGWEDRVIRYLNRIERKMQNFIDLMIENETFRKRLQGVGYLSQSDAKAWGVTGPPARGSGLKVDVRYNDPFLLFDEIGFEPIVLKDGDCWARSMVRFKEILQSIDICRELARKLPGGDIRTKAPKKPPEGEVFNRVEMPRGEGSYYIVSDGGKAPYRVKIRSPAYIHIQATRVVMPGHNVADLPPILGSLDVCLGDTDR
ncbi:MAG: NADH-quinone oxidoreductase subunit D [Archaeoglobaceae archaeon]